MYVICYNIGNDKADHFQCMFVMPIISVLPIKASDTQNMDSKYDIMLLYKHRKQNRDVTWILRYELYIWFPKTGLVNRLASGIFPLLRQTIVLVLVYMCVAFIIFHFSQMVPFSLIVSTITGNNCIFIIATATARIISMIYIPDIIGIWNNMNNRLLLAQRTSDYLHCTLHGRHLWNISKYECWNEAQFFQEWLGTKNSARNGLHHNMSLDSYVNCPFRHQCTPIWSYRKTSSISRTKS